MLVYAFLHIKPSLKFAYAATASNPSLTWVGKQKVKYYKWQEIIHHRQQRFQSGAWSDFLSESDNQNVFRSVKWVTQITNWRNGQMNNIFSRMFTPPTFVQKRLSHVTLSLFPFDVVILNLWHSRLKDVKRIVPEKTPCFVRAPTVCCSTLFNFNA